MQQVEALLRSEESNGASAVGNLKLQPRQVVLFPNRFKGEAPEK
jgi:hypothetical protein